MPRFCERREIEMETSPGAAFGIDGPLVIQNNSLGHGQAKTGPVLFRGVIGIEDMRKLIHRDPRAGVGKTCVNVGSGIQTQFIAAA